MIWRIRLKIDNTFDGFKKPEVYLGKYRGKELIAKKEEKLWYVTAYAKGDKYIELLTNVIRDVEEILDKVSFQIMKEVTIQEILMSNMSKVFRINGERKSIELTDDEIRNINESNYQELHLEEWLFSHGFKNQRGNWKSLRRLQPAKTGIDPIINNKELESVDKNALKWFVKALGTNNEVDQFTNYIICLDILSHKLSLNQRNPICSKCKSEIEIIHNCGESFLIQPYAMDYLKKVGLSEEDAKKFNTLRNAIFHGRKNLSSERLDEILDLNNKLKNFLTNKLREVLGIAADQPPILNPNMLMVSDMHLQGFGKQKLEVFQEIKKIKFG